MRNTILFLALVLVALPLESTGFSISRLVSKPKKFVKGILGREPEPLDPLELATNPGPVVVKRQPRTPWGKAAQKQKYAAIEDVEERAFQILSDLGMAGQQN